MANMAASNDPQNTRQYAGHVAHRKHLAEQEAMRQERRKARLKAKRAAKGAK